MKHTTGCDCDHRDWRTHLFGYLFLSQLFLCPSSQTTYRPLCTHRLNICQHCGYPVKHKTNNACVIPSLLFSNTRLIRLLIFLFFHCPLFSQPWTTHLQIYPFSRFRFVMEYPLSIYRLTHPIHTLPFLYTSIGWCLKDSFAHKKWNVEGNIAKKKLKITVKNMPKTSTLYETIVISNLY